MGVNLGIKGLKVMSALSIKNTISRSLETMTTGEAVSLGGWASLGGSLGRALLLSEIQITMKVRVHLQYPLSVCLSVLTCPHPSNLVSF